MSHPVIPTAVIHTAMIHTPESGADVIHTTVIIPTLHSPWLTEIADALRKQDYDLGGTEVFIIGEDRLGPSTVDELIQYIPTNGPLPPAQSRNIGIQRANGELLCFLDSDCIPQSSWLKNLTSLYQDPAVNVVGGVLDFPKDFWTLCDTIAHFNISIGASDTSIDTSTSQRSTEANHLPSLNFSARRTVFQTVGGFDEAFLRPSGEDSELTKRMVAHGYALHVARDALIYHAATRHGLWDLLKRSYHHGQAVRIDSYREQLLSESRLFRWFTLLITAIPRAALLTAKIYLDNPHLRRYWYAAPVVFMVRLTWILSAALALFQCRFN